MHCPVVLTTRSTPNSIDDCAGRAHQGTSRVRGSTLIVLRLMVVNTNIRSSLKTGPARPGDTKIVLDITAVEFDQFSLYSTSTMIMYDRISL